MLCIRPGLSTTLALSIVVGLSARAQAGNHGARCCTSVGRYAAPAIGTVFMPVSLPVTGHAAYQTQGAAPPPEDTSLRSVHAAELAQLGAARARAVAKAEIEAAQRVLDRLNAADCPKPQPDLKNRINDVVNKIDQIADRISAIEKLSLIHDNYLREDAQKANCPKGTDTTPKR